MPKKKMPKKKNAEKEKFTSDDIIKWVSHFIMVAAILIGSFVIRGNTNKITELENRAKLTDTIHDTIKVIEITTNKMNAMTFNTNEITKLREELNELTKRFNASKIPIKKSKTKKKRKR